MFKGLAGKSALWINMFLLTVTFVVSNRAPGPTRSPMFSSTPDLLLF
jgi:hypothetical protein